MVHKWRGLFLYHFLSFSTSVPPRTYGRELWKTSLGVAPALRREFLRSGHSRRRFDLSRLPEEGDVWSSSCTQKWRPIFFARAISELKQDCWRNCIFKIYGYTHTFYIYYEWCSVIKSSKGSPSLLESSCHTFWKSVKGHSPKAEFAWCPFTAIPSRCEWKTTICEHQIFLLRRPNCQSILGLHWFSMWEFFLSTTMMTSDDIL